MAGYYNPKKDYSKAIEAAKASGKDTSRLERAAERAWEKYPREIAAFAEEKNDIFPKFPGNGNRLFTFSS